MANDMRDRLIKDLRISKTEWLEKECDHETNKELVEYVADYLIDDGWIRPPCKCKDCDHFNNYNPDRTYCEEHSDGWGDNIVYVDEDDYCSFGIRKKEGADNG